MDENKLEVICDLNNFVAETLEDKYTELEEGKDSNFFLQQMAKSLIDISKIKIVNKDRESLMMAATLLEATANILADMNERRN